MPEFNDQNCPRCGSTLITNGRRVSCSFVGGRTEGPCSYGIDAPVFVGSFPQRPVPPDRTAFTTAILEQPSDDTARLVYADHLRESDDSFDQSLGRFIWSGVTLSQFRGSEPVSDGMFFDAIKEQAETAPRVLAAQLGTLLGWVAGEYAWDNDPKAPDRVTARLLPERVEGESITDRRARRRPPVPAPAVVWEKGCVTLVRTTLDQWCEFGSHLLRNCPITRVEVLDVPGLTFEIIGPNPSWKLSATSRPPIVRGPNAGEYRAPTGVKVEYPGYTINSDRKDLVDSIGTASRNAVAIIHNAAGEGQPHVGGERFDDLNELLVQLRNARPGREDHPS